MPNALKVPASIEDIIRRLDASKEPVDELTVSGHISTARNALTDPSEAEHNGAWAEALAFALRADVDRSPWNTYFGPMGSMSDNDGNTQFFPDIAGTPPIVVEHWIQRANSTRHPVLLARYADLAWEFASLIGQKKRDPNMARIAIDAYLASADAGFRSEQYHRYCALERAISLAILLKDEERIDKVRVKFMRQHRETMKGDQVQWWRAFDRLLTDKNARVTDAERAELIADAERLVALRSDTASPSFDPHSTKMAADRLVKLHTGKHRGKDIARLHLVIAKAFEHFASMGDAMLASSLLQTALNAYAKAGQPEEAKRIRIAMQQKISESRDEMRSIGTDVTIKKDDVEAFLNHVIIPDLGQTFVKLAVEFLPKRKTLEEDVKKLAEEAPLMAHISQQIMADNRVVAIIGSVEDDLFGRLFQQAKFTFTFSHIWLRESFNRLLEIHNVVPEQFTSWANRHGLFDDTSLLLEGVRAFYDHDHVKVAHVLIPQVEHAMRAIAGQLGKPVTKPHQKVKGASVVINMGDILYDDAITSALGDDLTLYFLSLYADPRGYNLRNELAHGELEYLTMNDHLSHLLIHTLLVLGLWKELSNKFAKKEAADPTN
jgi:lysyl-tRNA synthetase, class I